MLMIADALPPIDLLVQIKRKGGEGEIRSRIRHFRKGPQKRKGKLILFPLEKCGIPRGSLLLVKN